MDALSDFAGRRQCFKTTVLSSRSRRARLRCFAFGVMVGACAILYRLYSLQIADFERWQDWSLKQHFAEITVASERGPIYDRAGNLLAVSVPAGSVYVRPRQVRDVPRVVRELSTALTMSEESIRARLAEAKPFVWVARQVPRQIAEEIAAKKLLGVGYVTESRRFYPYNEGASVLIGKVGTDGVGLSGLEKEYEEHLHGEHVQTRISRDALGKPILVSASGSAVLDPPRGDSLRLTLDASLQLIADEELEAGRRAANASGALAVLLDAEAGDILAMSQAPAINFNTAIIKSQDDLRNSVLETVFEPGSTMKPIIAAAAIEGGLVRPADLIDCENGRYYFGRHTIKDVHPVGTVSVRDVVIRSSNIGMTKIGAKLGRENLYRTLREFGFGTGDLLGLAGESGGILRPLAQWSEVDIATHSFGQGVAVTPLQMVRAISAIANGGRLPDIRLIEDGSPYRSRQVLSERTAAIVREMLYGVVEEKEGTGSRAAIAGLRVGGKTGTAQIARRDGRGYEEGAYNASFVGFVDGTPLGVRKMLSLIVVIQEPNTKSIYGGTLAAPVFRRIMWRSLNYLAARQELKGSGPSHLAPKLPSTGQAFMPVAYRG